MGITTVAPLQERCKNHNFTGYLPRQFSKFFMCVTWSGPHNDHFTNEETEGQTSLQRLAEVMQLITSGARIQTQGSLIPESPHSSFDSAWKNLTPSTQLQSFSPLWMISIVSGAYDLLKDLQRISNQKKKYIISEIVKAMWKIKLINT